MLGLHLLVGKGFIKLYEDRGRFNFDITVRLASILDRVAYYRGLHQRIGQHTRSLHK